MKKIKISLFILLVFLSVNAISFAESAQQYFEKAGVLSNKGDYTGAIEYYNKAEKAGMDNNDCLYYYRANFKRYLHRYEDALVDFNEAIRLKPDYVAYYFDRGLLLEIHLKDYKRAIQGIYIIT